MAQMIEELSIMTADRRRKKPREVPRPGAVQAAIDKAESHGGGVPLRKHGGMLAAAMGAGRVKQSNG